MCQSPTSALSTCLHALWCGLQLQGAAALSISGETLHIEWEEASFNRPRFLFTCCSASFFQDYRSLSSRALFSRMEEVLGRGEQADGDLCWLQPQRPRSAQSSAPCLLTDGQVSVVAGDLSSGAPPCWSYLLISDLAYRRPCLTSPYLMQQIEVPRLGVPGRKREDMAETCWSEIVQMCWVSRQAT